MKKSDFTISLSRRLVLFICLFIVGYVLTSFLAYLLGRVLSGNLPAVLRISALAQDVIAFIIPAVIAAVFSTRRPAELLCLMSKPKVSVLLFVFICAFVSVPAQEAVIYWNYNIKLPESMAAFAETMRNLEQQATNTMMMILDNPSVASLILNILIIGIAAAVAEELFFRGCFQRFLTTAGVSPHVAIWLVAICFSAMHLQFYGFVPRMLLGAYFGYLLLWTGSIYVPVTAHMLNNILYVVASWIQVRNGASDTITAAPQMWSTTATAASALLTAAVLFFIYRLSRRSKQTY